PSTTKLPRASNSEAASTHRKPCNRRRLGRLVASPSSRKSASEALASRTRWFQGREELGKFAKYPKTSAIRRLRLRTSLSPLAGVKRSVLPNGARAPARTLKGLSGLA